MAVVKSGTKPGAKSDACSTKTTCPYCGVGCGVRVTVQDHDSRLIHIQGDETHPANFGRLCSKGSALAETVALDGRLLEPELHGERVSWDLALDTVAQKIRDTVARYGPESVAFYLSGQLLTEDYYVANKLMKGFIGSANVDTNSRLCMASSVAGHKRAFGSDTVPVSYEDLETADLVLLTGSNLAWCHPVLFQRLRAAKEARPNMKIVVIDPRKTDTCDIADLFLPIKSGTDSVLFNGLLHYLASNGACDYDYLEKSVENYSAALSAARTMSPNILSVATQCQLKPDDVGKLFQWFLNTPKTVTVYSQGVNQSIYGTDKVNSIINCHLLTGRIGKPSQGPFSVTGQPNAMGGREVGGLANQLAAHMDFDSASVERVERFWQASNIARKPGLKAVDMFNAIDRGDIKFLWVMATNPAVSMPNADMVAKAIAKCEFVVVSDCVQHTDTLALAHLKLPATTWGEKSGTVTNSERRISRQRAFLAPPKNAKHDWWMVCEVAKRLGFHDAFSYANVADIFKEHAQLSSFENFGTRDFDIGGLSALNDEQYSNFEPVRWPLSSSATLGVNECSLFANGKYFTANGKAKMLAVQAQGTSAEPSAEYPLQLNTGRLRDQWHTMTRTGLSPRLSSHQIEPTLTLSKSDAQERHISSGDLVRVRSRFGALILKAKITDEQVNGNCFAPIHWNRSNSAHAVVSALSSGAFDAISGQPELKAAAINVEKAPMAWQGFLLSQSICDVKALSYHTRARSDHCYRYELAHDELPNEWPSFAKSLVGAQEDDEWLEFVEPISGFYRAMQLRHGKLMAAFVVSTQGALPEREWLSQVFAQPIDARLRLSLLAGRPANPSEDTGRIVCSCFRVGEKTLSRSIKRGCASVQALGAETKAGTNCGSCIPELRNLIAQTRDVANAI